MQLADQGKLDDAIRTGESALALREKASLRSDPYRGILFAQIAQIKRTKGDFAGAEQLFQKAIAGDEEVLGRDNPKTADAMRGLAQVYIAMSDFGRAEPLLRREVEICESTLGIDHPVVSQGLRWTALLHEYLNDLQRARAEFERALAIAEKAYGPGDVELIAIIHDLGNLYVTLEDYDRAQPLIEKALTLAEQKFGKDSYRNAAPLRNLGSIAIDKKEYPRALELLGRALALREKALGPRHPDVASILNEVADVYQAMGDYPKSLEARRRAQEIFDESLSPYHRLVAPESPKGLPIPTRPWNDGPRALEYQRRSQEALEKVIAPTLAVGSESVKFEYLRHANWGSDRTISLQTRLAPDDPAARELALSVLLQRKGRVLDAMSGNIATLRRKLNDEDRKLLDQLAETNTRLAKVAVSGRGKTPAAEYRTQLAALENEREKLEAVISARSAEFRAQSQPVSVTAVQAAIPPDAALIEYAAYHPFDPRQHRIDAYGDLHYIAYVLRHDGPVQWVELGPSKSIDSAVAALRQALGDGRRTDTAQLARALDKRIMQPVRPLLGGSRHLLISPDGALDLIPFEALMDERGSWLLARYSISYLTTGRDLLRMQVPLESSRRPVVFADPLFGEPKAPLVARAEGSSPVPRRRSITSGADLSTVYFAPLAGTAEEAHSIQTLFPDAELLTGGKATKAALMQVEAPAMLHIATHGFFLDDAPKSAGSQTRTVSARTGAENPLLRSGLALAGANLNRSGGENGILTALEASNLNLWGTRVVVLSACETGIGEVKNGEGVYGLRRAFFLAGAETLVMSLWPVSDRVTREIMTSYYTGLKNGLGRGEALRRAQLAMLQRKDRQHPFYWASFIQAGNWKSLNGR